jgi:UDP-N-acetylglucosamine--N-acetylmuramyl-(pentapeptide) pyrophosphoryl-undecaprenol N-acetylglucosamine transferase
MVKSGAARLIRERDLTPAHLSEEISGLLSDRAQLLKMAQAARCSRVIDAAAKLADLCVAAGAGA